MAEPLIIEIDADVLSGMEHSSRKADSRYVPTAREKRCARFREAQLDIAGLRWLTGGSSPIAAVYPIPRFSRPCHDTKSDEW